ncbi:MAG: hypothetical protein ACPHF2_07030, partial [Crocinitomicaceae bacterium]
DELTQRTYQQNLRQYEQKYQNDVRKLQEMYRQAREAQDADNAQKQQQLQQQIDAHQQMMEGEIATMNRYGQAIADMYTNLATTSNDLRRAMDLHQFSGDFRVPTVSREDGQLRMDPGGFYNLEMHEGTSNRVRELPQTSTMETQTAPQVSTMETQTDETRPPPRQRQRRNRQGDVVVGDEEDFSRNVRPRRDGDPRMEDIYQNNADINVRGLEVPIFLAPNQQREDPNPVGRVQGMAQEIERRERERQFTTLDDVVRVARAAYGQGDSVRLAAGKQEVEDVVRRLNPAITPQQLRAANRILSNLGGLNVVRPRDRRTREQRWGVTGWGLKSKKLNKKLCK